MDPHLDDGKILAHIDCSETIERAREALRAHRSQVDPDGRWFALSADLVRAAYPFEDFEVLASRVPIDSSHDDLFAGI